MFYSYNGTFNSWVFAKSQNERRRCNEERYNNKYFIHYHLFINYIALYSINKL